MSVSHSDPAQIFICQTKGILLIPPSLVRLSLTPLPENQAPTPLAGSLPAAGRLYSKQTCRSSARSRRAIAAGTLSAAAISSSPRVLAVYRPVYDAALILPVLLWLLHLLVSPPSPSPSLIPRTQRLLLQPSCLPQRPPRVQLFLQHLPLRTRNRVFLLEILPLQPHRPIARRLPPRLSAPVRPGRTRSRNPMARSPENQACPPPSVLFENASATVSAV